MVEHHEYNIDIMVEPQFDFNYDMDEVMDYEHYEMLLEEEQYYQAMISDDDSTMNNTAAYKFPTLANIWKNIWRSRTFKMALPRECICT
jgi:hypothetical protein